MQPVSSEPDRWISHTYGSSVNHSESLHATKRIQRSASPFRTTEQFAIEDIIDPRDTRPITLRLD